MTVVECAGVLRLDRDLAFDRLQYGYSEIDTCEVRATVEVAGREDVHFENFVTDDIDANQKHAVRHQLGSYHLGNIELDLSDLYRLRFAPGVDIGPNVVLGGNAP